MFGKWFVHGNSSGIGESWWHGLRHGKPPTRTAFHVAAVILSRCREQLGSSLLEVVAGLGMLSLVEADNFIFFVNSKTNCFINYESNNAGYHKSVDC